MSAAERIRLVRMLDKMQEYKEFSEKLGVKNRSVFTGGRIKEEIEMGEQGKC